VPRLRSPSLQLCSRSFLPEQRTPTSCRAKWVSLLFWARAGCQSVRNCSCKEFFSPADDFESALPFRLAVYYGIRPTGFPPPNVVNPELLLVFGLPTHSLQFFPGFTTSLFSSFLPKLGPTYERRFFQQPKPPLLFGQEIHPRPTFPAVTTWVQLSSSNHLSSATTLVSSPGSNAHDPFRSYPHVTGFSPGFLNPGGVDCAFVGWILPYEGSPRSWAKIV